MTTNETTSVVIVIMVLLLATIMEAFGEYNIMLSNMSGKTTEQVEELIAFEKYYSPEEKATSNYNFTSMCEQLLQRPDVSANGILDCEDILNRTKAIP